jgi:hypothetical protein
MPETNERDQPRETPPNWVEKATLAVLTATMIIILIYTCITNGILRADTRPYVMIPINRFDQGVTGFTPIIGQQITYEFRLGNSGRTQAFIRVRGSVEYTKDKPTEPPSFTTDETITVLPNAGDYGHTHSAESMTSGQFTDMQNGIGWLCTRFLVSYDGYQTAACILWPFKKIDPAHLERNTNRVPILLGEGELCPWPETNRAD